MQLRMEVRTLIYTLLIIINTNLSNGNSDSILQFLINNISPQQFYNLNDMAYRWLGRSNHMSRSLNVPAKMRKLQVRYPDTMPFPCDVTNSRSPQRPISVHALRPGDIDVIGAMGDSLTAGYGAVATDLFNVAVANRGMSWSIGGQSTWREFMTLPNILKEFNPNLVGYSLGDAPTWSKKAQFNVAEGGAISRDMPHQAKIIVKRMKSDKRVNFDEDWKIVTLFIGGNDHCGYICYDEEQLFLESHRRDILQSLDTLHQNVPRLLVNIMPGPNLEILMKFTNRPLDCVITQAFECPCITGLKYKHLQQKYIEIMKAWQQIDVDIGNSERYRDREDFAVVVQPFSLDINFPQKTLRNGRNVTDYSYMSADCFHFSQKCSAITANALWNNMLEPVGKKSRDWSWNLMDSFLCPTPDSPYIYTHANS